MYFCKILNYRYPLYIIFSKILSISEKLKIIKKDHWKGWYHNKNNNSTFY